MWVSILVGIEEKDLRFAEVIEMNTGSIMLKF